MHVLFNTPYIFHPVSIANLMTQSQTTIADGSPAPFHSPQLKKQNDKESARDMTNFKPSNFDRDFKAGKGWGSLGSKVRPRNPFDDSRARHQPQPR